ncbi:MAG: citrate lyase subunit alpha [Marinilabiliales bacterium]|nr:MAG: citrate lyase subunit alpha [Marinilabiliales bacterium]
MKNAIGIELPEYIEGYGEVEAFKGAWKKLENEWMDSTRVAPANKAKMPHSSKMRGNLKEAILLSNPKDGMTVSFHHHLRGGDGVLIPTLMILKDMGIKDITLASSSLTSAHEELIPLIKDGTVTKIWSSGIRGKLGETISRGYLKYPAVIHSHGGRARAIRTGKLNIDLAIIAASASDKEGNATGAVGPSAFGSIGYAAIDAKYATQVIVVTDNIVDYPCLPMSIRQSYVDHVVNVEKIGDANKIASGTTRITKSPMDLRLAELAAYAIEHSGYFEEGFSFQVGAGGASLAVARFIRETMKKKNIKGSFMLGGVTSYVVEMLEEGLFNSVFDVQSFDAAVSKSLAQNTHHIEIPSTLYANPFNCGCMTNKLDIVVLGALEVDVNFNVNVITGSEGNIRGASGGHSDTASGAKLTVVVAPSFRGRIPIIKEKINNVVTPGESVDLLVTERGICVNPNHTGLEEKLKKSGLMIKDIKTLAIEVQDITGIPRQIKFKDKIVGIIEYRDGTVIDLIHEIDENEA